LHQQPHLADVLLATLLFVHMEQHCHHADERKRNAKEANEANESLHVGTIHMEIHIASKPSLWESIVWIEADGASVVEEVPPILRGEPLVALNVKGRSLLGAATV
jgi:hypothetical protein